MQLHCSFKRGSADLASSWTLNLFDVQVAGAITFKNYVKRNWKISEEGQDKIHQADRAQVKTLIVDLMLTSPLPVQKQLSQAIAIIGKE